MRMNPIKQDSSLDRPGSAGEHVLQAEYGTQDRADRFYAQQMSGQINARMREYIGRMEIAFVATSDSHGECDATFRAGPPGFIRVLDENTVAWPEYRGNGVMASLGNMAENPHVGILFVDFVRDLVGLHLNGGVEVVAVDEFAERYPDDVPDHDIPGRRPDRWVVVSVEEAYIRCSKHVPRMMPVPRRRAWGTDDVKAKGGDAFGVASERRASQGRAREPGGRRLTPVTGVTLPPWGLNTPPEWAQVRRVWSVGRESSWAAWPSRPQAPPPPSSPEPRAACPPLGILCATTSSPAASRLA
jgi:uncharacterized protein